MQHTVEKITTKFNVTEYGVSTYNEQGIMYEEVDNLKHLDYDDPFTVI